MIPQPVALAIADLHFWHRPPVARSCEDWWAVQKHYLAQLKHLQHELSGGKGKPPLPILCAGDVFDKWNAEPETINFLLEHMPHLVSVCGQHDLHCHRYESLPRTAYYTLVKACRITHLHPGKPVGVGKLRVTGFNWGQELKPNTDPHGLALEVAVIHKYIWSKNAGTGYPGASEDGMWFKASRQLRGFNVAVFGDNHKSLLVKTKHGDRPAIYNPGTFLRRKLDEVNHRPQVGIIYEDGTVGRHYLDCSEDKFLEAEALNHMAGDAGFEGFLESLSDLGSCALDFSAEMKRTMERDKVPDDVKQLIFKYLDAGAK